MTELTTPTACPECGAQTIAPIIYGMPSSEMLSELGAGRYSALVGSRMQILVEGPSKKNAARMMGRTRCNRIVVFDGSERHRGQVLDVEIVRSGLFTLYGDPAIVNLEPDSALTDYQTNQSFS